MVLGTAGRTLQHPTGLKSMNSGPVLVEEVVPSNVAFRERVHLVERPERPGA